MPINANTFNSRVTSEALERKFRDVFPAQGGAELIQDLYAAGTIQPVIDFSSVAEGSVLAANLQTAWDFSTGSVSRTTGTATIISTPGFWKIDVNAFVDGGASGTFAAIRINDGVTNKAVWSLTGPASPDQALASNEFVVFLRSGDVVNVTTSDIVMDVWYRQIADVNGTLVNPLGFTFS